MLDFLHAKHQETKKAFAIVLAIAMVVTSVFGGGSFAFAAGGNTADNGTDLASLQPTPVAFAVGGNDIKNGFGFKGNIYYVTESQLEEVKSSGNVNALPELKGCLFQNVQYSSFDNHNKDDYHYNCFSGFNLEVLAGNLGVDNLTNIYAESTDGYNWSVNPTVTRYAFQPGATTSNAVVKPALAYARAKSSESYPTSANNDNFLTFVFYSLSEIEVTGSTGTGEGEQGGSSSTEKKTAYKDGDDISDSVFYIAVKDDKGALHYYYYTMDEIKAFGEETSYTYVNHSMTETTTTKGVKITTLLDNLDMDINDNWIIQYAEEDGYHADKNTAVESSSYKDRVIDLREESLKTSGTTEPARNASVAYAINIQYDTTADDQNNVSDPDGVFNTFRDGFLLRGYRQTNSANSAVLKFLIGITISPDGTLLEGNSGCTVNSYSSTNRDLEVVAPTTIKGLVSGMKWAAKAKAVPNAELAKSQNTGYSAAGKSFVVTAGTPADVVVDFYYDEGSYFKVTNNGKTTDYRYTDMVANGVEIPAKEDYADYTYYGYNKPMYVRYNGCWLKDLVGKTATDVVIKDQSGATVTVKADEVDDYFVAYNYIQSKKSTNIANYKRVTTTYEHPAVIKPATAAIEYSNGDEDCDVLSGKTPEVLIADAVTATTGSTGSGGTSTVTSDDNQTIDPGTIEPGTDVTVNFKDVKNHGASEAIKFVVKKELFNGISVSRFGPDETMTRGMLVTVLWRLDNKPATGNATDFADVDINAYYAEAVAWANARNIVLGKSKTEFAPNELVTREQVAVPVGSAVLYACGYQCSAGIR